MRECNGFTTLPFAEKYYKTTLERRKKAKAVFIVSADFFDDGKEFIGKMMVVNIGPSN